MKAYSNRSLNWFTPPTRQLTPEPSASAIVSPVPAPSAFGSSSRIPLQGAMRLSPRLRIRVDINNANLEAFHTRLRLEEDSLRLSDMVPDSDVHKQAYNRILIFHVTLAELKHLIESEDAPVEITSSSRQLSFPVAIAFDNEKSFRKDATAEFSETGRLEQLSFDFPGFSRVILNKDGIAEERLPQESIESDRAIAQSPIENVYDTLISRSPTPDVVERAATPHAEMVLAAEVRQAIDSLPETLNQRQEIVDWISASVVALMKGLSDATKVSETSGSSVHQLISAISPSVAPDTTFRTEMDAHVSSDGQVISLKLQCPAFGTWEFPAPGKSSGNVGVARRGTIEEPSPLQVPGGNWTKFIDKIYVENSIPKRNKTFSLAALAQLTTKGIPCEALRMREDAPPGMSLKAMQVLVKSHPLLNDGSLDVAGLLKEELATRIEQLAQNHDNRIPISDCEQVLVALSPATISRSLLINLHGRDVVYGNLSGNQKERFSHLSTGLTEVLKYASHKILKPYENIEDIRIAAGINLGSVRNFQPSDTFNLHLLNIAESAKFKNNDERTVTIAHLRAVISRIEKQSDPWTTSFMAMLAQQQGLTQERVISQIKRVDPTFWKLGTDYDRILLNFLLTNLAQQLEFFNSLEQETSQAETLPTQSAGTNTSSQIGLSGTAMKRKTSAQSTSAVQSTTVEGAGNASADVERDSSTAAESENFRARTLKRQKK